MENSERLEKIKKITDKIFELELSYPMGEHKREILFEARKKMGAVDHHIRVEMGLR